MITRDCRHRNLALAAGLFLAICLPAAAQDAPAAPDVPEASAPIPPLETGDSFVARFSNFDRDFWYKSHGWKNGEHQGCDWVDLNAAARDGRLQLTMRIKVEGKVYTCAEVQTRKRYGYGLYEVRMKPARGSGLNSAFFTYIGPSHDIPEHDEVDFEFLGKDTTKVQLNYFVNGDGANVEMIDLGFDAADSFNDYAFDWREDGITWYINGEKVHETAPGARIPTNPSIIFMSLWSGSSQLDDWLGPFTFPETRPVADYEWVAYTRPGDPCQFEESVACSR